MPAMTKIRRRPGSVRNDQLNGRPAGSSPGMSQLQPLHLGSLRASRERCCVSHAARRGRRSGTSRTSAASPMTAQPNEMTKTVW